MAGAPYQFDLSLSDDTTFRFTVQWDMTTGDAFPWSEFGIEYVLREDGAEIARLSREAGIEVDTDVGSATFAAPALHLRPGRYQHGCRVRQLTTGETVQVFDGTVTIIEGGF